MSVVDCSWAVGAGQLKAGMSGRAVSHIVTRLRLPELDGLRGQGLDVSRGVDQAGSCGAGAHVNADEVILSNVVNGHVGLCRGEGADVGCVLEGGKGGQARGDTELLSNLRSEHTYILNVDDVTGACLPSAEVTRRGEVSRVRQARGRSSLAGLAGGRRRWRTRCWAMPACKTLATKTHGRYVLHVGHVKNPGNGGEARRDETLTRPVPV